MTPALDVWNRILERCEWVGDCLEWQGGKTHGYGTITRGGMQFWADRCERCGAKIARPQP